jgi:integrase
LNRLIQPIKAALLHYEISKGKECVQNACVLLLLHEMHRRQTSLWAWDDIVWAEIVGNTNKDFKRTHHDFEHAFHISSSHCRRYVLACAYLLGGIPIYQLVTDYVLLNSAQHIFGGVAVEKAIHALTTESTRIGRGLCLVSAATCTALLANRSPDLEKITLPVLEKLYERYSNHEVLKGGTILVSKLLYSLKIIPNCLPYPYKERGIKIGKDDTLSADWTYFIQMWYDASTETEARRTYMRRQIAKAARWAAEKYPDAANPQQWTRSMAIAYVAAVARMKRGQWVHPETKPTSFWDKPLKAAYQMSLLTDLRSFFKECHASEWFPKAFNPDRYLATPKSILAKQRHKPRPIAPAQWIKLQEAGLSLTEDDLPLMVVGGNVTQDSWYPLAMVRAIALVWLYSGLRADEIRRLQVGCIRPIPGIENEGSSSIHAICTLIVPVGKSGSGFSKPVLRLMGDPIEIWEKNRPTVPKHWDDRAAEAVDYLFVWRGKQVGYGYLNDIIIPMLCRKAGIPIEDEFGKITSHRARHTLATQLSNAPTPMSDSDLQYWFGHHSVGSLKFYTHGNERKLQEAYAMANHVSVDKRQLEHLKNPTTIAGDLATVGESVPSVDLGHGFCIYDFFADCKQRTPCANCSFYKPKVSLYSELQEATSQLQRMLYSLPLSQEVRQAIEDAIAANETLVAIMRRNQENQEDDHSKSEGSAAADIEGTWASTKGKQLT